MTLLFSGSLADVERVLALVLSALPGVIDGPVSRSVFSSHMDTPDSSLKASRSRVRMETDRDDDRRGGWVNDRTGAAGRWIVQRITPPSLVDGTRMAATVEELVGPYQGGAPAECEPLWPSVFGRVTSADLRVVSLGRIHRRRWVAHDGDGVVCAEITVDHCRALGTQEVIHELIVRFDQADAWTRRSVNALLVPNSVEIEEHVETGEPVGLDESDLTDADVVADVLDDVVPSVQRLAYEIHHHIDALTGLTSEGTSRQLRQFYIRHMLMFEQSVHIATELDEEFAMFDAPLSSISALLADAVVADLWVKFSTESTAEFRSWAKEQSKTRANLVRIEVSSLVEKGLLSTLDTMASALTASESVQTRLDEWLSEQLPATAGVVSKRARLWKRAGYPPSGADVDALIDAVALHAALVQVRNPIPNEDDDSLQRCLRDVVSMRASSRIVGDLRQAFDEATDVKWSIPFDAGTLVAEWDQQIRRRTRAAIRRVERLR